MTETARFLTRQAVLTGLSVKRVIDACSHGPTLARAIGACLPPDRAAELLEEPDVIGAVVRSPSAMSEFARVLRCAARLRCSLN